MTSGAERLEALLANISDIVTVMGANGEWISSSGAGNRLLGWEPDLDPEGGIFELLHPDDVDAAAHAFAEVIAGTRTSRQPIDLRVLDAHGTYHILETFAENLLHDDRINGIVLTSRDVTAARAAEAEQLEVGAQLAALVSSLSDAVLFLDGDRKVVLVNQAFTEMFGIANGPGSLTGWSSQRLIDSAGTFYADRDHAITVVRQRYLDDEPTLEELVTLLDGRVLERDSIPVMFGNGQREHLWLFRDVTEREELARRRSDQLNDTRRAQLLAEERNQALLDLADMRSQFVATISHELRTPLASIISFSELLRRDLPGDDTELASFVDVIDRNAQRLPSQPGCRSTKRSRRA